MGRVESRIIGDNTDGGRRPGLAEPVLAFWPLAVAIRVVVAGFLVLGPATDEPAELAGWDAERFQEITDRAEPAWSGQPVEYPPGSVVILDRLAGGDTVSTHRRLVALSAIVDLGTAALLWRRIGTRTGQAFLLIGLPLVPLGYQRLDTLVTGIATVAALALLTYRPTSEIWANRAEILHPSCPNFGRWRGRGADGVAAVAIAAGAMIKIWPLVLVVAAVAIGRWRAALAAVGLTAAAGAGWLAWVGAGLEPLDQVLSLRGATGWHVESLPGAMVALTGGGPGRLELNAFRIGTLLPGLVTAGRAVAVALMGLLALAGLRRSRTTTNQRRVGPHATTDERRVGPHATTDERRVGPHATTDERRVGPHATTDERRTLALAGLGATAALLVTAPLLSPQFLVWLLPFAALLAAEPSRGVDRAVVVLAVVAAALTGMTLTGFGPSGLDQPLPAALLTLRNLTLAALPLVGLAALSTGRPARDTLPDSPPGHSTTANDVRRERSSGSRCTAPRSTQALPNGEAEGDGDEGKAR